MYNKALQRTPSARGSQAPVVSTKGSNNMRKFSLFLLFCLIIIINCSQSTSPKNELKLTDYSQQYQLIYRFENNIYSINSDGTGLTMIKEIGAQMQDITINNDFSKIAFASILDGYQQEIYTINMDGSELQKITEGPSQESKLSPRFLPLENALIYNYSGKLFRINNDGSAVMQITPDSLSVGSHNSTSIFADRIVFSGQSIREPFYGSLFLINTDGSDLKSISSLYNFYSNPIFSPSGEKIIYKALVGDYSEIFIMNIDGSENLNLSNNSYYDDYPGWSPDGSKIHFETHKDKDFSLNIINPDGSGLRKIINHQTDFYALYFLPTWSPDLTRMAFAMVTGDVYVRDTIFILDIESGSTMKLTNGISSPIWINRLN